MTKPPSSKPKPTTKTAAASAAAKVLATPHLEAHLEAMLGQAIASAFPHLDRSKIRHQTVLKVRIGRDIREFDADVEWEASGRADILIFYEDRCLAVLEAKRANVKLTPDDPEQAQSYANQFTPRPPLLIITNGEETLLYDSSTGQPWSAGTDAEKAVAKLLGNATAVAAADMKWAIDVLIGPGANIWPSVVRDRTGEMIGRQMAQPGQGRKPFVRGLKIPRDATRNVVAYLRNGAPFVLVDGPPLVGKSNVLRELAELTAESEEFAVLLMRGGAAGLYQTIANVLSAALEWEVSKDNVRQWLRRLSSFGRGPTLVLAIDGLKPGGAMADDLEEVADQSTGDKVRVVATTDDARRILYSGNDRTPTAISDAGTKRITMGPLSAGEFAGVEKAMAEAAIHFLHGAAHTADYRAPWVLRALYDRLVLIPTYDPSKGYFVMPSTLGLSLIDETRASFSGQDDVLRAYRLLARDAIDDIGGEPIGLALARSYAFIIRRDALSQATEAKVDSLTAQGWLTHYRNDEGDDVVAPTAPELFISELSREFSRRLEQMAADDPVKAAYWMANRLEGTCFSDLVGAQAIRDLLDRTGSLDWRIIETLLAMNPEEQVMEDATVALSVTDGSIVTLRFKNGRAWLTDKTGTLVGPALPTEGETQMSYGTLTPWMILGQLAAHPMAIGDAANRADAHILIEIGRSPIPLLRATPEAPGHLVHDLGNLGQIPCTDNGVIETTTASMARLLSTNWQHVDAWIDTAIETESLPLLHRVMIALMAVKATVQPKAAWANDALTIRILPAIDAVLKGGLVKTV